MSRGLTSMLVLALTAFGFAGCQQRIGDFTVLSSQNVNFAAIDAAKATAAEEFEGRDIKFFGIPSLEEALDDALRQGKGNVMIDAALYVYNGFFTHGYIVKGKVINAR